MAELVTRTGSVSARESQLVYDTARTLRESLDKRIVGNELVKLIAVAALMVDNGSHILLEGPAGTGKTSFATTLAGSFTGEGQGAGRVQMTPDLLPSDITGYMVDGHWRGGVLRDTHVLHVDELNRANGKTQSALFEAMSEGQVTVGDERHELLRPFFVIATQNPVDRHGTFTLPGAILDRFAAALPFRGIDLSTLDIQGQRRMILGAKAMSDTVDTTNPVAVTTIQEINDIVSRSLSHLPDEAVKTLSGIDCSIKGIDGVKPYESDRGVQSLARLVAALALMSNRSQPTPNDYSSLVVPVYGHRIVAETPELDVGQAIKDAVRGKTGKKSFRSR